MPNILEYSTIFQDALDRQLLQQATSGWMEANAGQVRYTGGKEVKIPVMSVTGLGDYDRANDSYPNQGSITLGYETFALTQDRAGKFTFDRHDVDETNFVVNATAVMSEFQRTKVIPEIDAYRYSKIAATAIDAGTAVTYTPDASTVLSAFLDDLNALRDRTGLDGTSLVATVSFAVYGMLEQAANASKTIVPQQFEQGGLDFEVKSIDGVPIIPASSARMKSAYIFHAGNSGDAAFGFEPDEAAQNINWIICPRSAPIAVSKTENVKIFAPDDNLLSDGWLLEYRKYHDIWIKQNQIPSFAVNVEAPAEP